MNLLKSFEEWWSRLPVQMNILGSRLNFHDITFSAILLALNSILWPYRGLVHDAKLYALQALNHQQHGQFAQDLFFQYGSQDRFSIFSAVLGPVVGLFGLEMSFWLTYVFFSALFIYAAVRLTRSLIPERGLANIGVMALVAFSVSYGGWQVLHVKESFFTARLAAEAFSLLAVESILQDKKLKSIAFALAGMAFHPLMGIGSLLAIVAVLCWDQYPKNKATVKAFFLAVAALLLLVIIKWDSILLQRLATDAQWMSAVKDVNWYCFPSEWRFVDCFRLAGSVAITLFSSRWLKARARILVVLTACAGVAGFVSTLIGEYLHSPLLLQGQGYRATWIIEVLAIPLGVFTISRLADNPSMRGKWAALGVFFLVADPFSLYSDVIPFTAANFPIYVFFLGIVAIFLLHKSNPLSGESLQFAVFAAFVVWSVVFSIIVIVIKIKLGIDQAMDPISVSCEAAMTCSRAFLFMASLVCFSCFMSVTRKIASRRVRPLAALLWIVLSCAPFSVQEDASYRARFEPARKDLKFIAITIKEKEERRWPAHLQIYWPNHPELVWFGLQSDSYFSFVQLGGAIFSKNTCVEGQRRIALVRPFEIAAMANNRFLSKFQLMILKAMNTKTDEPAPTREDLLRLVKDEKLDWIVLNVGFNDLYCATNKSVFIYDASEIRRKKL